VLSDRLGQNTASGLCADKLPRADDWQADLNIVPPKNELMNVPIAAKGE
jgi:hypothetical protein